jgi:hypothetical protein
MKNANILTKLYEQDADVLATQVAEYLRGRTGIPPPSFEEFCVQHNYEYEELSSLLASTKSIIKKIYLRAIMTLDKYLAIDVSQLEFEIIDEKGRKKSYKLDKRGIIEQLKQLRKILNE